MADPTNKLYYGDNLDVLRRYVMPESVDLVYLDPPFNSQADYNILFEEHGERAAAQVKAFGDTWEWNTEAARSYAELLAGGGDIAVAMRAFRSILGDNDMLAYLAMMAPRLIALHSALAPTGSLFLHCDPTASHYLKVLLDRVFGPRRFRNEIAWCYWGPGAPRQRQFSRKHNVILWYSKGSTWTWNADAVRMPHAAKTVENYRVGLVGSGFAPGVARPSSVLAVAGKIPEDWWPIAIAPRGKEYLGYPTQKPLKLLDRIIRAASNEGDVVLDPFCGCGTSVDAAEALGRKWIGIDVTHHAIGLIKHRLIGRYGPSIMDVIQVTGEPTTAEDAAVLARDDPYQFQAWALGLVGARKGPTKKGGDRGVDGRLFFHETTGGASREIVFSVKAGGVNPGDVRDLRGVVEREAAEIGVLISFVEPSPGMRGEAASAGLYDTPSGRYPRVQIRTVAELLAGRGVEYPTIPTPFRGVFWDEDQLPRVERSARRSARRVIPIARPAGAESTDARRIREALAAATPRHLPSPRTSKRDRPALLPSPEPVDRD